MVEEGPNFTIKVEYFLLTKLSDVSKHMKMNYFPKISLQRTNTPLVSN